MNISAIRGRRRRAKLSGGKQPRRFRSGPGQRDGGPLAKSTDDLKVLSQWLRSPKGTGAIAPSGRALARAMVAELDPAIEGTVVELGPGTGPVTQALVESGFGPDRLVLVEQNRQFRHHLETLYGDITVVEGDAFEIASLAAVVEAAPLNGIVSSLPLLNWPQDTRRKLLDDCLSMLPPGAPFVQFTYGPSAPIACQRSDVAVSKSKRIWLNLPPATVWAYRRHR